MQSIIIIVIHVNEITELSNDFSSINLEVVFFSIDFFVTTNTTVQILLLHLIQKLNFELLWKQRRKCKCLNVKVKALAANLCKMCLALISIIVLNLFFFLQLLWYIHYCWIPRHYLWDVFIFIMEIIMKNNSDIKLMCYLAALVPLI